MTRAVGEICKCWKLPLIVDVAEPGAHEDQVDGSLTQYLVCDVDVVARYCVAGVWDLDHTDSLHPPSTSPQASLYAFGLP
jgi:hypothetical protein